jgi:hypothetical protein
MDQNFSWETNNYPLRKLSAFDGARMFNRVLKQLATNPHTEADEYTPFQPITLRYT